MTARQRSLRSWRPGLTAAVLAVVAIGLLHCRSDPPVIAVKYAPRLLADDAVVETDLGYAVRVREAFIVVAGAELVPCDSPSGGMRAAAGRRDTRRRSPRARSFEWHGLLGVSRARAHLQDPDILGQPLVLDMLRGQSPLLAGYLFPATGQYCGVRTRVVPADDDAALLPMDVDMVGVSLHLTGSWQRGGGEQSQFAVRTNALRAAEPGFEGPVELEPAERGTVGAELGVDSWFEGIDFADVSPGTREERVLENIEATLQASYDRSTDPE